MKYSNDCVRVAVYVITSNGWEESVVWLPREVALSESQDQFREWAEGTDQGREWLKSLGSNDGGLQPKAHAVFVKSFEFEADAYSQYLAKGDHVKVARDHNVKGPSMFGAEVGQTGVALESGRIGPGATLDTIDILLDNGNEVTAYGAQLDSMEPLRCPDYKLDDVLTPAEKVRLSADLYQVVFDTTESFHGAVGGSLAYLLGAIANDDACEFNPRSGIMKILKRNFLPGHAVWAFVREEV